MASVLSAEKKAEAIMLVEGGMTNSAVAARYGVSKNVIIGIRRRAGKSVPVEPESTLLTRCKAYNDKMDAVLRETKGVGRISG